MKRGLAGHAEMVDVVVAVALTIGALTAVAALRGERSEALSALAATACTSAVGVRRRAPKLAAFVALTAVAVYQLASQDPQGVFVVLGVVLTCYSVGAAAFRDNDGRPAAGIAGYALVAVGASLTGSARSVGEVLATWLPVAVIPMAVGALVARGTDRVEQLRAVYDGLRDEDRVSAQRLVAEERSRVARDLHDVVAHCVSVMVIQTGVARLTAADDPGTSRESMDAVVSAGRDALVDLRRVVGVLRRTDSVEGAASPTSPDSTFSPDSSGARDTRSSCGPMVIRRFSRPDRGLLCCGSLRKRSPTSCVMLRSRRCGSSWPSPRPTSGCGSRRTMPMDYPRSRPSGPATA